MGKNVLSSIAIFMSARQTVTGIYNNITHTQHKIKMYYLAKIAAAGWGCHSYVHLSVLQHSRVSHCFSQCVSRISHSLDKKRTQKPTHGHHIIVQHYLERRSNVIFYYRVRMFWFSVVTNAHNKVHQCEREVTHISHLITAIEMSWICLLIYTLFAPASLQHRLVCQRFQFIFRLHSSVWLRPSCLSSCPSSPLWSFKTLFHPCRRQPVCYY